MMEKEDAGHDNSSEDATTNVNQQDNAGVDTQTDVSSKAKNIINHDEIEWQITQDVDNSSSREAVVAFDLKDDGSLNMSCSKEVNNELDSKQPLLEASSEPNATRDATSESLKNVATPVDVDEDNHETSALIAKEGAPLKSTDISVNNDVTIQNNQSKSEIIDDINLNININNKNSNNESDNEGSDDNIDCSIDDALDEGCMDLQGTLERGFSLQESSQTSDRAKLYEQMRINYQHETLASKRYAPALKHFIPVRSEKCAPLEMPVDKTGMVSYTMFSWMTPIMWRAYKKGLTQEDMPICSKYDMCDYNTQRLERLWNAELQQKGPAKASLQRVVWKFIRTRVYFGLLLFIVTLMFGFAGPTIFMRYLIEWLSTEEPVSTGLLWVVGLILTDLCRILTFGLVWAVNYRTGVRLRSACLGLVYKKLMRLSALGDKSVGEMINLFANDGQRIFDFVVLGVMIIGGPVVGVGGVAYILWLLGPYALCGMLAFLLFYPLQYGISRLTGVLRRRTVTVTDERVRLMNELLACIKLIKMYAWEDSFASAIDEVRQKEKVLLEKSAYVQSVSLAMAPTVPVIAAILTFVAHIAAGNNLTPAQAMVVLAVMGRLVRSSLTQLQNSVVTLVDGFVSLARLKSVLLLDELEDYVTSPARKNVAIQLSNATLAWPTLANTRHAETNKAKKNSKGELSPAEVMLLNTSLQDKWIPVLWDISISINKGELVGVCGSVGAGKSSLLFAILGQMKLMKTNKTENTAATTKNNTNLTKTAKIKDTYAAQADMNAAKEKHTAQQQRSANSYVATDGFSDSKDGIDSIVAVDGDIAYVGQQAWILNTTLRENILMGDPFDPLRYFRVIYACSLTQDLDALPAGDLTEIGERGINLSGGQKQRLSLARALYSNKSIYLLDDPLSAVDGEVGWHIFRWAVQTGLKQATVVLVTHQLQYLPECDRVVHLHNGRVLEVGSHRSLMASNGEYAALYASHRQTTATAASAATAAAATTDRRASCSAATPERKISRAAAGSHDGLVGSRTTANRRQRMHSSSEFSLRQRERSISCSSAAFNGHVAISGDVDDDLPSPSDAPLTDSFDEEPCPLVTIMDSKKPKTRRSGGALTSEERVQTGNVDSSIYLSYMQAAGGLLVTVFVVISFGINVGSTAFSSWWLSHWLSAGSGNTTIVVGNETVISTSIADNPDVNYYQTVYASTVIIILSTSLARGAIFMKVSIHAATRLHERVLQAVFRSPMSFFETTPVGRILNIFSRDMDEVDVRLPMNLEMFLQNVWLISCSLLLVCLVFWQFLPMLLVLAIIFMFIRNVFRIGIRDFKRLENVSRSPLYSHVSTTLAGLPTIRAYGKHKLFTDKFLMLFDESSTAFYLFNCAMRWLAIRLDILALGVTASTAVLTVMLRGQVEAAFAGLALAYASQLSGIFQYTVRLSTETEARFTSVERIHNYINCLPSEGSSSSAPAPALWPQHGRICFRKVAMRYRHNTPLVFEGLNFDIHEMEKIGVVGRTGSGKSSLATCLFRLVELSDGIIRIDGTDISKISLQQLRSKLSVIPQDPVLFSGTIRYNLDPFNHYSDMVIWDALEKIQLKDRVSVLPLQLSAPVAENGDNFSVGERQLMCMARALLRNSKILVLDEATASIDTESDALIQGALKSAFEHCTLLTIAHRINTVLWCSRVMVMDAGKLVQFDTPHNLLLQRDSLFAKMVAAAADRTGVVGS